MQKQKQEPYQHPKDGMDPCPICGGDTTDIYSEDYCISDTCKNSWKYFYSIGGQTL